MTDEEIRNQIRKQKKRRLARRRLIAFCVTLLLTVGVAYGLGTWIGNGTYDREISRITPVADYDVPIVDIGMQQVGNEGGEPFWSWYGFSSREEWCACFVSWCEDQCGYIEAKQAPSFALVSDGSDWFIFRDQWLPAGSTPQAGDLIFFDWDQDDARDHVGIVTAVIDDMVFTVEGNSSDRCRQKRYSIEDPVIYGYGHIITEASADQ